MDTTEGGLPRTGIDPDDGETIAVFLSYAHEDERRAQEIISILEEAGLSVWWDGHLGGGQRFAPVIQAALERAKSVVVLWSKAAVTSHWVQDEAEYGRDHSHLVPLSIDGTLPPLGFRQFHVIDVSRAWGNSRAPEFDNLIRAVSALNDQHPVRDVARRSLASPVRRRLLIGGAAVAAAAAGYGVWRGVLPVTGTAADSSVVVLPFSNISNEPAENYFSDGLAAEIRGELARNPLLQVVAQTSSNTFRDRKLDAKSICRQLSVSFLLDGNVRRSRDSVRIVAELISGQTGFTRWSRTFEQPIADVFAVQSEIAEAIAGALSHEIAARLGMRTQDGAAATMVGSTTNVAAYDAFLRGKDLFSLADGESSDRAALARFDEAISLDPRYGMAHAARSRALAVIANVYSRGAERRNQYDAAIAAAKRAVDLAPQLADAHSALGFALFNGRLDVLGARASFDRSGELGSGDADVMNRFALFCARTGRFDEARSAVARAAALDPLNARVALSVGAVALASRRYADAVQPAERALSLNPHIIQAHALIGETQLMLGRTDAAAESFAAEPNSSWRLPGVAILAQRRGQTREAQAALKQLVQEYGDSALYQQAEIHAQWGERRKAVDALLAARAAGDSGLLLVRNDPLLDPLRDDPDFVRLLQELGFR